MVRVCNDSCINVHHGVNKSNNVNYNSGYRFCKECRKYFLTELWKCPCCSSRLRCKPANGKKRELLVQEIRI